MVYPLQPEAWIAAAPIGWVGKDPALLKFARYEGMPNGTLTLNEGVAASTSARFSDGEIDFDIKPLAYSDTGVIFRRQGNDGGEFVYLRANPDCPAANDCIQYAPISHGLMQWDIYPDHQGPAPISSAGWNHMHIVVSGERMVVYVNHEAEPSLTVPRLQGLTAEGGIAFKGPAVFANVLVRKGEPNALAALREETPDAGVVTRWLSAPPTPASDGPPQASALPTAAVWRPIAAEPSGLVNLSRAFGQVRAPLTSTGWLKTTVTASTVIRRTLRLGWARQLTVFVNGRSVFSEDNPYYPTEQRISPDGRLAPDNASISIALRAGQNEIVLAVGNAWRTHAGVRKAGLYGWAAEASFDDLRGIKLE